MKGRRVGGFATSRLGWYERSKMWNGEEGSRVPGAVAVIWEERSVVVVAPMEVQNGEEGWEAINSKLTKIFVRWAPELVLVYIFLHRMALNSGQLSKILSCGHP